MPRSAPEYVIAQFSDVHCGDPRFDESLMLRVVREVNEAGPDLVIVPGDLTQAGYQEQFEAFASFLDLVECRQRVVIAGNHDCRNVGYLLFERVIGARNFSAEYAFHPDGEEARLKVLAVDSNIPDLNDGEVGRDKISLIREEFAPPHAFKLFVLHHHLVSIPGTGRERNVCWDAGDVLQALRDTEVDLVLAGHKHVPYAWPLGEQLVVTSGTAASHRTRGDTPPSYNLIRISRDDIGVTIRYPEDDRREVETFRRRPRPVRSARAR